MANRSWLHTAPATLRSPNVALWGWSGGNIHLGLVLSLQALRGRAWIVGSCCVLWVHEVSGDINSATPRDPFTRIASDMKMRKVTSLTALVSFILVLITSTVLYVSPQGRVAYWADWHLWGLSKTDWGNIHINLGALFLLALLLHIYYNWNPLLSYLKNHARQMVVFTRESTLALILVTALTAGTYFQIPPCVYLQDLNEFFKTRASRTYGEPPYGHAELSSVRAIARRMELDPGTAMDQLEKAGIRFDNEEQSILEIARLNGISPRQVYDRMSAPAEGASSEAPRLPEHPAPGFGKLSLSDVARQYNLDTEGILRALRENNIPCTPEMSIKDLASKSGKNPLEIYETIKKAASEAR